jgi:hypothetical protein
MKFPSISLPLHDSIIDAIYFQLLTVPLNKPKINMSSDVDG